MSLSAAILTAVFLLFSPAHGETPPSCTGVYTIPVTESTEFAANWLRREGFALSQSTTAAGTTTLVATRGRETVRLEIRPRSALGSVVVFCSVSAATSPSSTVIPLKSALEEYLLNLERGADAPSARIPEAVTAAEDAVVCLKASLHGEPLHFSGFVVTRGGVIVTTAHDLDDIRSVTVVRGSEEMTGTVVKRDPVRDLTLVSVKKGFTSAVDVPAGKRRLQADERVYQVHCPGTPHERVISGLVSGQQAVVNGQILWQVTMAVSPGSSGSPVFDREGRLVGVVKGRYRGTDNRGFLIPLETLAEFLAQEIR